MITIFTPTYNRAYRLPALYKSLQAQTCKEFEWLVVDDGSTDDTARLFEQWTKETDFPVRYLRQENGGKHRAINRGAGEANGELFFIVDSDDFLAENAVERILHHAEQIDTDDSFAGVCGMKAYQDGTRVGGNAHFDTMECSLLDFKYKQGIAGDLAEVYRTDILKQFPFPDIPGEKFCSEALVWFPIARKYKLHFFNEPIYVCEYLPDGLTTNSLKVRIDNPRYAMATYCEMWKSPLPIVQRVKFAISYWRFRFHGKKPLRQSSAHPPVLFAVPGLAACLMDKWRMGRSK